MSLRWFCVSVPQHLRSLSFSGMLVNATMVMNYFSVRVQDKRSFICLRIWVVWRVWGIWVLWVCVPWHKPLCHLGYMHTFGGFCLRVWCLWLIIGLLEFDQVYVSSWSCLCQLVSWTLWVCLKSSQFRVSWTGFFFFFFGGGLCPRCDMSEHSRWI